MVDTEKQTLTVVASDPSAPIQCQSYDERALIDAFRSMSATERRIILAFAMQTLESHLLGRRPRALKLIPGGNNQSQHS